MIQPHTLSVIHMNHHPHATKVYPVTVFLSGSQLQQLESLCQSHGLSHSTVVAQGIQTVVNTIGECHGRQIDRTTVDPEDYTQLSLFDTSDSQPNEEVRDRREL